MRGSILAGIPANLEGFALSALLFHVRAWLFIPRMGSGVADAARTRDGAVDDCTRMEGSS
jgi:hypothetical protein